MLLVLSQVTVLALPNNPKTNQPARKSKRKLRRQREVKPASPAEVILAREQIAALTQRVTEMSQQLTSQTAMPTEDADARREIAELKARIQ
ncbi:MAG TPA: hypothetical protein VJS64_08365, partial [Pyrinomonadaceae bacterium]|nr:hypothetical protein [Pyrinomonadaceae bacterium]